MSELINKNDCSYVGLEPLHKTWRAQQYAFFSKKALQRFGLLLDTGAPQSAAGANLLDRFITAYCLQPDVREVPFTSRLSGIGTGSATVRKKQQVPIGMYDTYGQLFSGYWEAQRLEGIGQDVPFLLGLDSMFKRSMIIDLRHPDRPVISVDT